jgi:hypothetical protein
MRVELHPVFHVSLLESAEGIIGFDTGEPKIEIRY